MLNCALKYFRVEHSFSRWYAVTKAIAYYVNAGSAFLEDMTFTVAAGVQIAGPLIPSVLFSTKIF